MRTVISVLKDARNLVASGWTSGVRARDSQGVLVPVHDGVAVCYCALGALDRASGEWNEEVFLDASMSFKDANCIGLIAKWNDAPGRTQAEVLAAFDRAIAAEEGK